MFSSLLGQRNFRRLGLSLFVVPYTVATACGLGLGVLSCVVFSNKVGIPWGDLGVVAAALLMAGLVIATLLPRTIAPARTE